MTFTLSKRYKTVSSLLIMAVTMILSSSCEHHSYEVGDGELSYMTTDMADITIEHGMATNITTDDNRRLKPSATITAGEGMKQDTVVRRLIYYNIIGTREEVDILKLTPVEKIKPHEAKDMPFDNTDALKVTTTWTSKNKLYANLQLGLMSGNNAEAEAKHRIALRMDRISTEGKGRMYCTLCHDQGGLPQYYTSEVYVSIPMPTQDTLSICINTYEGTKECIFVR